MKSMISRFRSKCAACGKPIQKGEPIMYDRTTRKAYHDNGECTPNCQSTFEPDRSDIAYEDRCAAMCGRGL